MANEPYVLQVPVDLSDIEDKLADDQLKVVAQAADESIVSTVVTVGELGSQPAELSFPTHPGTVRVAVGPAEADDRQVLQGDTVRKTVPSRMWNELNRVSLAPIKIGRWFWGSWKRWCRTITVEGRLICPDGRPVPGAEICAYDIDWWFIWSSKQLAGCTTTAADGSFTLTFTWCCGLYPWWWWFQTRPWILDQDLSRLVHRQLSTDARIPLAPPTVLPSLSVFQPILAREGGALVGRATPLSELDPDKVEAARNVLVKALPDAPELARLQIWPWAPWTPWRDCSPDLVFKATQDCGQGSVVILDEGPYDTRWDVPDQLSVTLVANDKACCRPDGGDEDCLVVDEVCAFPMHHVAGNLGAPATPGAVAGYLVTNTDGVDQELDIPFGGSVPVSQNPSDLAGVDYYAFEHSTDGGLNYSPLPIGAAGSFNRSWMLFPGPTTGNELFKTTVVGAYEVYETRRHFQDTHYGDWDPVGDRFWLSTNYDLLSPISSGALSDGVHHFRVVQFTETGPGEFSGPEPVLGCDGETPASFVLSIDNRAVLSTSIGHDPDHNCGAGVHLCTVEPDTHIARVWVDGVEVGPCDTVMSRDGLVEIDFMVTDPDGHLSSFALTSHWGSSNVVDLTAVGTVVCTTGGPDATTYAQAVALGAVRPTWEGGHFRLTVPVAKAFPDPCCYLLRLEAHKRTLESCVQNVRNVSEMTLGIGV